MRQYLESVLGTYTPQTYQATIDVAGTAVTYEVIPEGLAGLDWGFIITAMVLVIGIASVFKLAGVLLKGLFR